MTRSVVEKARKRKKVSIASAVIPSAMVLGSAAVAALSLCLRAEQLSSRARSPLTPPPATTRGLAGALEAKIKALSEPANQPLKSLEPIVIRDEEANAYLKVHGSDFLPPAVHSPEVSIHAGGVEGTADVDFDQLNQAAREKGDLEAQTLATLFNGKRKITVTGKLSAAHGQGQVAIENLTIGTVAIPDWLVKLLVENYVQKKYNLDVSKPFPLPDHVNRIVLAPDQATFYRSLKKDQ